MPEHGRALVAVALAVLATAGCGRNAAPTVAESRTTARAFYEAVVREDWPAAFAMVDAEAQARLGADGFAELGRRHCAGFGFSPVAVEVRSCDETGDQATAQVIVTGKSEAKRRRHRDVVALHKGPAGWRVVLKEGFGQGRR